MRGNLGKYRGVISVGRNIKLGCQIFLTDDSKNACLMGKIDSFECTLKLSYHLLRLVCVLTRIIDLTGKTDGKNGVDGLWGKSKMGF